MYTPSAYTLTNTTRPHELNAKKSAPPLLRWMGRGKIGILAKEQTVHNCTNDRITDRSTHSNEGRDKRGNTGTRVSRTRVSPNGSRTRRGTKPRSRPSRYTMKSKLPWFSSVQPRALTHISIHKVVYEESWWSEFTHIPPPSYTLHPCASRACTHTYFIHTFPHFVTHFNYTLNYTRYGYVKPIDFVNCRKRKNETKAANIRKKKKKK